MKNKASIAAIYDFELFPYALGDVLTWNVRTAMRCVELGRDKVDIYICVDERYPAGIYQRGMINPQNYEMFFSELYGAFSTHPMLGNIHIFRNRDALLAILQELVVADPVNAEAVRDYLEVLEYRVSESVLNKAKHALSKVFRASRHVRQAFNRLLPTGVKTTIRATCLPNEETLNHYFIKYIHSHESINEFAARRGGIPLLQPALGCTPDVDELMARRFAGKMIVPFHLRLRRLDAGYGGEHSYDRDSDFLEWYDFLREAGNRYPDVEFIALGRLQEKPIELLKLPNVTSLRMFGMGLGHELTLMLRGDLFIGTSSGFAALANFSTIPYFITRMNPGSCHAYAIAEGADCLPFAVGTQKLIYARETSELLMGLLESGLGLAAGAVVQHRPREQAQESAAINIQAWLNERAQPTNPAATTSRFFDSEKYREAETAFLVLSNLERVRLALLNDTHDEADAILLRLQKNFPELCKKFRQFLTLQQLAAEKDRNPASRKVLLETLDTQANGIVGTPCSSAADNEDGWRPDNWVVDGGKAKTLPEEPAPAFNLQAASENGYWHTDQFVAGRPDGTITLRFEARNAEMPSRHRLWIFEDGAYRSVGEFVVMEEWRAFRIPVRTRPGAILELQIDQASCEQWLSVRNFLVIGGESRPLTMLAPVTIPLDSWSSPSAPCSPEEGGSGDSRKWIFAGSPGYTQSPILPKSGTAGLMVSFEARADRHSPDFTSFYLFEGDKYRTVAQYDFGPDWKSYSLLLRPVGTDPLKVQIDYPEAVDVLMVRDFKATPADLPGGGSADAKPMKAD
jgi:hypothetical protein